MKRRKYFRIVVSILCIITILCTMYYFRPLNANEIFPEFGNIEKVDFAARFYSDKEHERLTVVLKGEEVEYFQSLLEMARYKRVFGKTNIHSQENAYDLIMFHHHTNNYSVILNDKGYVVVEGMDSKKKYKILSSKKDRMLVLVERMLNKDNDY